jgi:hypothetical protein
VTGSISRKLYRRVLLLYPEPFRHEFGNEMLNMFVECKAAQGSWHVLADVLLSAAKQQITISQSLRRKVLLFIRRLRGLRT